MPSQCNASRMDTELGLLVLSLCFLSRLPPTMHALHKMSLTFLLDSSFVYSGRYHK